MRLNIMMARFCRLPLLILAAGCCVAQDQWRPVADRIPKPSVLRPRYSALSPAELLQRAAAARVVPNPTDALIPVIPVQVIQIEEYPSPLILAEPRPAVPPSLPSKVRQPPAPKETRSYRKSYSAGRREQQTAAQKPKEQSANLKELLKQAGTLSLSEILQQKNLSLADFLQGKKTALSALKEQQSLENEVVTQKTAPPVAEEVVRLETTSTSTTERPTTSTHYPEIVYRAPEEETKRPNIYKAAHRTSYLKRSTTPPPTKYFEESERYWLSEDGEKADSREDILELLQPGSPVSLAALLSSRNMTLAELMDHRERGSQQQSLTALFADLANGVTTTPSPRVAEGPKRKGKISRDPRLLDLPRRFTLPPEEAEEEEQEDLARNLNKVSVDHYDYVEDEEEEEAPGLPTAVKSAILASGGLLGVALLLFAAIFVGCRTYQRRQRGSRTPFIINGKHVRTVIKPASNKAIEDPDDF